MTNAEEHVVLTRPRDGVALITLDRPGAHNAISMDMQRSLDRVLTELELDPEIRCAVVTGAGDRAFSAGYDVLEMAAWSRDELAAALEVRERWLWHVATTGMPLVAAINGIAWGVGALIAAAVDIRVGCPATRFRFTAGNHGGANATWSLPHVVGLAHAKELLLTAREVGPHDAERMGLLNEVVGEGDVLSRALEVADEIAANPRAGMREIKRLLDEGIGRERRVQFEVENRVMLTTLLPPPISELYSDWLEDRS